MISISGARVSRAGIFSLHASARAITSLVRINLPGIAPENISCDREVSMVEYGRDGVLLRLALAPDEFAVLTVTN